MGDRRHVIFQFEDGNNIYLYSQRHGSILPAMVANALREPHAIRRYGDGPYLTRILIESIICQSGDQNRELGWGVAPYYCDSEYPDITIQVDSPYCYVAVGDETPVKAAVFCQRYEPWDKT